MNTYNTDSPICPYCGYSHEDWWEDRSLDGDGATSEYECAACEKEFTVHMEVITQFCTTCKEHNFQVDKLDFALSKMHEPVLLQCSRCDETKLVTYKEAEELKQ